MEAPSITYDVVIYWSAENSAYIAEVPDLPGCVSDGETYAEAAANAEDAARAWIETAQALGRSVPAPVFKHARAA